MPNYLQAQGSIAPFQNMGHTAGSIAFSAPYMQLQGEKLKQQMLLQRAQMILREAQMKQAVARSGYYDQKTAESMHKMDSQADLQKSAEQAGEATSYKDVISQSEVPSLETMRGALSLVGNAGLNAPYDPDKPVMISRGDLVNMLGAIQKGAAVHNALSTAAASASMMQPYNIPQGGTAINRFGDVMGMGQPKPTPDLHVRQNELVYPGGDTNQQPIQGLPSASQDRPINVGPGHVIYQGGAPVYTNTAPTGNVLTDEQFRNREAIKAAGRLAGQGDFKHATNAYGSVTGLPSSQSQPTAPQPKIVIQNGNRFQLNPDGSHQYLGPAQ